MPHALLAAVVGYTVRATVAVADHTTDEVQVAVDCGYTRPPFTRSTRTHRQYALAERACEALGEPLFARSESGGSDASFAAALGTPTLDGLGPVCHDSCSSRERVEVASIVRRGAAFGAVAAGVGVVL